MPSPAEHKTVQARILAYAQEIGWTFVPRTEAEKRRGITPHSNPLPVHGERGLSERAQGASLYFGDLLHAQVRTFNPKYKEAEGALIGEFQRLNSGIAGNRDFLAYLRNQGKFFCAEENRELDLSLIDYDDLARPREQWRNVYEVTEEFYVHNGRHGTREDVVFLINGIPILVIECKNATKDEAIAIGNRPDRIVRVLGLQRQIETHQLLVVLHQLEGLGARANLLGDAVQLIIEDVAEPLGED